MNRFATLVLAAATLTVAAHADEAYQCRVTDMITAPDVGHDLDFEARNKRKQYTLVISGSTMRVDVTSPDYQDTSNTFTIVSSDRMKGIVARGNSSMAEEVLMLSPTEHFDHPGEHKATLVHQYTLFVNSWHLLCKPIAVPTARPKTGSLSDALKN